MMNVRTNFQVNFKTNGGLTAAIVSWENGYRLKFWKEGDPSFELVSFYLVWNDLINLRTLIDSAVTFSDAEIE